MDFEKFKPLVYLTGAFFLLATIIALLNNHVWTIYFAITALIFFLIEAIFIKRKHLDPIGIIIIVLIIIILFKIFS